MPIVKVKENFQITLPAAVRKKFKIAVGDYVEAEDTKEGIVLKPVKLVRPDQAWFYTEEWQKGEREADEAIAKGEVVGPFGNTKDALEALKKAKSRNSSSPSHLSGTTGICSSGSRSWPTSSWNFCLPIPDTLP